MLKYNDLAIIFKMVQIEMLNHYHFPLHLQELLLKFVYLLRLRLFREFTYKEKYLVFTSTIYTFFIGSNSLESENIFCSLMIVIG